MSFTKINNKNNTSNANINNVNKKPYCKVCHDAGKEEAIYTSHYVKSEVGPKGKVVCPTLLEQVCKGCLKKGHTISYCSEIKKQDKIDKKNNYNINNNNNNNKATTPLSLSLPKLKNKFELLQDSDSEEEDYKNIKNKNNTNTKNTKNTKNNTITKKEEFPALTSSTSKTRTTAGSSVNHFQLSYAEMANKGHEMAQKEEILTEIYESKVKAQETKKPIILVAKKKRIVVEKKIRNWADYSTDEDDDEDDEYEYYQPRNILEESFHCCEY